MSAITPKVIKTFCSMCNRVHKYWMIRRRLFDDNPNVKLFRFYHYRLFFEYLTLTTLEHSLLQLSKLHDPAVQNGDLNLTIDYVVSYGNWDKGTMSELKKLRKKIDELAAYIKPARNKILSHNDYRTILENNPLGKFPKDKDLEYFEVLQSFVNLIHDKSIGGPFPFSTDAFTDVEAFLALINKGIKVKKKQAGLA